MCTGAGIEFQDPAIPDKNEPKKPWRRRTIPKRLAEFLADRKEVAESARASGEWCPWDGIIMPERADPFPGDPQVTIYNDAFLVSIRRLSNGVRHLRIISPTLERPSWWEMQRIKNEVIGPSETAVEVYPPENETIDGLCMYHLWVLPMGARLPFSLWEMRDEPIEDSILGAVEKAEADPSVAGSVSES